MIILTVKCYIISKSKFCLYFIFLILLLSCENEINNNVDKHKEEIITKDSIDPFYKMFLRINLENSIDDIQTDCIRIIVNQSLGSEYRMYVIKYWGEGEATIYSKEGNLSKFKMEGIQMSNFKKEWNTLCKIIQDQSFFDSLTVNDSLVLDRAPEAWQLDIKLNGKSHSTIRTYEELKNNFILYKEIFSRIPFEHDWRVPW